MAKQFFYISIGILALTVAYHLVAVPPVEADWDESGFSCVAGGQSNVYWSHSGEAYTLHGDGSWIRESSLDLPVSSTSVAHTGHISPQGLAVITTTGEAWIIEQYSGGSWKQAPSFPGCGSAASEPATWGGIKGEFK